MENENWMVTTNIKHLELIFQIKFQNFNHKHQTFEGFELTVATATSPPLRDLFIIKIRICPSALSVSPHFSKIGKNTFRRHLKLKTMNGLELKIIVLRVNWDYYIQCCKSLE